jgi:hypothetical protein
LEKILPLRWDSNSLASGPRPRSTFSDSHAATDVDGLQLHQELTVLSSLIPAENSPENVLNFICKNRLMENFSNTVVALRIFLTLPITVASGERCFRN